MPGDPKDFFVPFAHPGEVDLTTKKGPLMRLSPSMVFQCAQAMKEKRRAGVKIIVEKITKTL